MASPVGGGSTVAVEFPELGLRAALVELAPVIRGQEDTELFYAEHPGSPHAKPWTKKHLALRAFWVAGCRATGMDANPDNW